MRVASAMLLIAWLSGCASPAAPEAPAPAPPSAPDAWQEAARMDSRTPVPLTPMMARHQKANMRDHLVAVDEIVKALAKDDFAAVEAAAGRLGSSPESTMMCEHMGAGAEGFTERGLAFHATADGIVAAARERDRTRVLETLGATLDACTACHAEYRQDVLTDAGYAGATGAAPPSHGKP